MNTLNCTTGEPVNDQQRGSVYEDVQQPGSEIIKEWVPDDSNGDFYKIERWFEFSDGGQLLSDTQPTLENFTTTGGVKKVARYRWNWLKRASDDVNNYTNIFNLVDALNAPAPEPYTSRTEALIDLDEWMGIFATEHMIDNFDSYGHRIGKNMYAFKPDNGKWLLFMFDIDWVMKESASYLGATTTAPLFDVNDPVIARMYNHPPFRRAYFRAVQKAVDGPFLSSRINSVMDSKYAALVANGVTRSAGQTLAPPTAVKQWIADRRAFLVQQLAGVAAPFAVNTPAGQTFETNGSPIILSGTAPIQLAAIEVNGLCQTPTWTGVNSWSLPFSLREGQNTIALQGIDEAGNPLPTATATLSVNFTGVDPTASAKVLINEWMANNTRTIAKPAPGEFDDWFELFNPTSTAIDLDGFTLSDSVTNSTRFIIPSGTRIPPNGYILVWADGRPELNSGADLHANFKLDQAGEQIALFAPNGRQVDAVSFGPQTADVSQGRSAEAPDQIGTMSQPTPGAANGALSIPAQVRILSIQSAHPEKPTLTWSSDRGQTYRIQWTDNLANPTWNESQPIVATDSVTSFVDQDNSGARTRFYRVAK